MSRPGTEAPSASKTPPRLDTRMLAPAQATGCHCGAEPAEASTEAAAPLAADLALASARDSAALADALRGGRGTQANEPLARTLLVGPPDDAGAAASMTHDTTLSTLSAAALAALSTAALAAPCAWLTADEAMALAMSPGLPEASSAARPGDKPPEPSRATTTSTSAVTPPASVADEAKRKPNDKPPDAAASATDVGEPDSVAL